MSVFDRTKNVQRRRDHSWLNGIDAVSTERPDYERNLLLTDDEIDTKTEHYMQSYQKALKEFKEKTSLTTWDMSILMVAAMIQTLRWALLSNDKMRFSNASDADKALDKTRNSLMNSEFVPAI